MDKKKVEMSVEENIDEMKKSLKNLEESDCYDVGKYTYSLLHQTRQLEYFLEIYNQRSIKKLLKN